LSNHIAKTAHITGSASLGHNCVVMEGAWIGEDVVIGHNVIIYDGTRIGDGVFVGDNVVLGRQPRSGASSTRLTSPAGPLEIGEGVVIGTAVVIYAGTKVGREAMVADLACIREGCVIGERSRIGRQVAVGENVLVGKGCAVQTGVLLVSDSIVEDNVFIGPGVYTCNDKYMSRREYAYRSPVIRQGASVGGHATLLPGVEIGRNAVVGAGAVVVKDVPEGVTVVGNPAHILEPRGK